MNYLYAQNRSGYFENGSLNKNENSACPFCDKINKNNDRENLILRRNKLSVVMLNLYPYNAGHILIIPLTHTPELSLLTQEQRAQIMEDINHASSILEKITSCEGINIGINKGKVSGGSIASHLHVHIVPRYSNDTNFMMVFDATKVISKSPWDMYDLLKPYYK